MKIEYRKQLCTKILFLITCILFSGMLLDAQECVFKDPQYSFQCLRTMGYSSTGGADISECLSTSYRIKEGDNESWYKEWNNTAEQLEKTADDFLSKGYERSAKEAYFRASNYYRTAGFFVNSDPNDPRILETYGKSRTCFLEAIKFTDHPVEFVNIPFEGTTLPGYLCLVDNSGKKRPLLIVHSGFDGTAEEIYFEIGKLAVERGFNCLLFEGPGQGEVVRKQRILFRPNWETVVTPVMDYAIQLPEVDTERIGLMGISFGGYFAPRAVAYEHRFKVCVANGGIYDFYDNMIKMNPPNTEMIINDEEASKEYDKSVMENIGNNPTTDFFFTNGMFTFGAKSPSELMRMLKPYNMKNCADKIKCTMLVVDSEEDKGLPGQSKQLFDALECPKEFMFFTIEEGAAEHCQMGAVMISGERILNWLENNLMN
jgi:esterase/lipase